MWFKATLSKIIKETDLTWKFVIKTEDKFVYKPGQFVQIKINDLVRSYSIASYSPSINSFELLIVKLDGGKIILKKFFYIKGSDNKKTLKIKTQKLEHTSYSQAIIQVFNK